MARMFPRGDSFVSGLESGPLTQALREERAFRGHLGRPFVHREPPLRCHRSRPSSPLLRRRRAFARRHARRPRDGSAPRVRLRRVPGPGKGRRGDPALRRATLSRSQPGSQRSAGSRRPSARRWRLQPTATGRGVRWTATGRRRLWWAAARRRGLRGRRIRWTTTRWLRRPEAWWVRRATTRAWRPSRTWWKRPQREFRSASSTEASPGEEDGSAGTPAARADQGAQRRAHLRRGRPR